MRVWFGSLAAQNKKRKFHTEIAKNAKGRRAWTCPEWHEDKGFLEWFFVPGTHLPSNGKHPLRGSLFARHIKPAPLRANRPGTLAALMASS
jgi:hypothetical protein